MNIVRGRQSTLAFGLLLYLLATVFIGAPYWGDTGDYVNDITLAEDLHSERLWEAGHLLWRPLGFILLQIFAGCSACLGSTNLVLSSTWILLAISWLSGLVSVVLMHRLLCVFSRVPSAILLGLSMFVLSLPFLSYCQTGTAYVPGLAMLLAGGNLCLMRRGSPRRMFVRVLGVGISFTLSVCFWFPYILAIPAFVLAPLIIYRPDKRRLMFVILSSLATGVLIGISYALVAYHLKITTIAPFLDWFEKASHGKVGHGGLARTVFGFAGSLFEMEATGKLIKRFMLEDPLNPVSFFELFRVSLLKLIVFYLLVLALFVQLLRNRRGRKIAIVAVLSAIPNLLFALAFDGGSIERYLSLHTWIFVAATSLFSPPRSSRFLRGFVLLAFCYSLFANLPLMSQNYLSLQEQQLKRRVAEISDSQSKSRLLVVMTLADQLMGVNKGFLYSPSVRFQELRIYSVIWVGNIQTRHWKEDLAKRISQVLDTGGEVWLSERLFVAVPHPSWGWVEGEDPHVRWSDVFSLFQQFETGRRVGGKDGFRLLEDSLANRTLLDAFRPGQNRS